MVDGFWSSDRDMWITALRSCSERVEKYGRSDLAALDSWFYRDLPLKLAGMPAEERHISSGDLVKIIEWKLKRGTWRPKLLDFAKAVPEEVIKEASQQAYRVAENASYSSDEEYVKCCRTALEPLLKIKGIGPASASAILTASSSSFPYFSDEAMELALSKKKDYTVKRYIEYILAVRGKARELSSKDHIWTERDVERAIQSAALQEKSTTGKNKRKRADA